MTTPNVRRTIIFGNTISGNTPLYEYDEHGKCSSCSLSEKRCMTWQNGCCSDCIHAHYVQVWPKDER